MKKAAVVLSLFIGLLLVSQTSVFAEMRAGKSGGVFAPRKISHQGFRSKPAFTENKFAAHRCPPGSKCIGSGVNIPQKPLRFSESRCKGGKCIGSALNTRPDKPQIWHSSSNNLGSHFTENKPNLHRCPPGSKCAGLVAAAPVRYNSISYPKPTVTYKGKK